MDGTTIISRTDSPNVTTNQSSRNAAINWHSFNIGLGKKDLFRPCSTASQIDGERPSVRDQPERHLESNMAWNRRASWRPARTSPTPVNLFGY